MSLMFMKKSRLSSEAGFPGWEAGEKAWTTSTGAFDMAVGGGGCRVSYAGIRRANIRIKKGRERRSRGSRVTSENIVMAEIVSIGFRHVITSSILLCTRNTTPTLHSKAVSSRLEAEVYVGDIPSRKAPKVASHDVEREACLALL